MMVHDNPSWQIYFELTPANSGACPTSAEGFLYISRLVVGVEFDNQYIITTQHICSYIFSLLYHMEVS